jgi:hypothetical protein
MGDRVLYLNGFHHFLILMTSSDKSTQRELGDGCASMARDPAPCDVCLWTNLLANSHRIWRWSHPKIRVWHSPGDISCGFCRNGRATPGNRNVIPADSPAVLVETTHSIKDLLVSAKMKNRSNQPIVRYQGPQQAPHGKEHLPQTRSTHAPSYHPRSFTSDDHLLQVGRPRFRCCYLISSIEAWPHLRHGPWCQKLAPKFPSPAKSSRGPNYANLTS